MVEGTGKVEPESSGVRSDRTKSRVCNRRFCESSESVTAMPMTLTNMVLPSRRMAALALPLPGRRPKLSHPPHPPSDMLRAP